MLLECSTEERELLLQLPEERERRIEEALSVLREAGDPRVTMAPPGLTVDVGSAPPASSLTSLRMSPRVSGNPYATGSILSPVARELAAVSLA